MKLIEALALRPQRFETLATIDLNLFHHGREKNVSASRLERNMKMKSFTSGSVLIAIFLALAPAAAQDITGTPGSPSATTTIPGDQLPAPL